MRRSDHFRTRTADFRKPLIAITKTSSSITSRIRRTLIVDVALLSETDAGETIAAARRQRRTAIFDALLRRIFRRYITTGLRFVAGFANAYAVRALHIVAGVALFGGRTRTAQPGTWIAFA